MLGRNFPVMDRAGLRDSSAILFAKKQRKKTLKIIKLCTKSCMSSDDQQSIRKCYCHKSNDNVNLFASPRLESKRQPSDLR